MSSIQFFLHLIGPCPKEAAFHPVIEDSMSRDPTHRFAVAPMMDYTDQHCRMLFRLISRRTRLYTEMVTAAAIVHGRDPRRFLAFDPTEEPLTLQLGGSN